MDYPSSTLILVLFSWLLLSDFFLCYVIWSHKLVELWWPTVCQECSFIQTIWTCSILVFQSMNTEVMILVIGTASYTCYSLNCQQHMLKSDETRILFSLFFSPFLLWQTRRPTSCQRPLAAHVPYYEGSVSTPSTIICMSVKIMQRDDEWREDWRKSGARGVRCVVRLYCNCKLRYYREFVPLRLGKNRCRSVGCLSVLPNKMFLYDVQYTHTCCSGGRSWLFFRVKFSSVQNFEVSWWANWEFGPFFTWDSVLMPVTGTPVISLCRGVNFSELLSWSVLPIRMQFHSHLVLLPGLLPSEWVRSCVQVSHAPSYGWAFRIATAEIMDGLCDVATCLLF